MKTCFIYNPRSGGNQRDPGLLDGVRAFIREHQLDATVACTEAPGHATELAREAVAAGHTRVVAIGGDGTLNEVAQALINTPAVLALVPRGSGNGLALHLRLPLRPRRALGLLVDPRAPVRAIDTGTANGHAFFNVMGFGFDADISERFNKLTRRGLPAYVRTGWRAWRDLRPATVTLRLGEHTERLETLVVTVANSDQYGNHARIAPGARVDDGRLDLTVIGPVNFFQALPLAGRLFAGNLARNPHVRTWQGERFHFHRESPGLIHTDGETHATGADVEVRVVPASLRVLVPPTGAV
jgi:YegS/Rv2252/BmrU family lipid kinase